MFRPYGRLLLSAGPTACDAPHLLIFAHLQKDQFTDRRNLENEILDQKSMMLLNHHAQLEEIEIKNQQAKHALQSRHLEEKCAFFDAEQKRFETLQFTEFEKEARRRRKALAKELKVRFLFTLFTGLPSNHERESGNPRH